MNYFDHTRGKIEVLGTPKTARLVGQWNGETFSAPLECWIACLVDILTAEQKATFFPLLKRAMEQRELQRERAADIRANILMPNVRY